jgi:thiol-disulfide isomerase/thioredoxin
MIGLLILSGGLTFVRAEPTLKIGDRAPGLVMGKWVQGESVKEFAKGKAYIVEFWATWCGPCRVSIPHLNEIHNKYKDKGLIVIGQDCWENDEKLVAPFVSNMGDKMTYRVALDDKDGSKVGKMAETWMQAAGRNGIPSAFLVDTKGMIAWIGHPMELKDTVIEAVLAGNYDVQKAARDYSEEQEKSMRLQTAWQAVNQAVGAKHWDEATAKLEDLRKLLPQDDPMIYDNLKLNILLGKGDYESAYKVMASLSEANLKNSELQNELAWRLVTDKSIKQPDLKLAETLATRANEAAGGKDSNILDTLARVKFMQGRHDQAVALEEKAVALAQGEQKSEFEKVLAHYRKGESPDGTQDLARQRD